MKSTAKYLMLLGVLLPLLLFLFPLWNITLEAPQYPIPLGMDIFIHKFHDMHPNDIQNINLMNHYVGMKFIPATIPEFKIFPIVILFMSLMGIAVSVFGNYKWYFIWFFTMLILITAGLYDFYLWEYDYGHNLDPKAIMKFTNEDGSIMGFQPPLFGSKDILNFRAHSYPRLGSLFLALGMVVAFVASFLKRKEKLNKSE